MQPLSTANNSAQAGSLPHRIVLISATYPPVIGGAEMDARRVSAELVRRGHEVLVLCMGGGPMPSPGRWVDDEGVPVRILTRAGTGAWANVIFALRVASLLWAERKHYDQVFFSMFGLHVATGLVVARLLGKQILLKVHGSSIVPGVRRSLIGRLELRMLAKWAARVMVLNDEMVQEALDAGIPAAKLMHMPNPIDVDAFSPASPEARRELRARLHLPHAAQVLLYTGRLSKEKGLAWLIDAFALAAEGLPEAMLVLVGDGAMRETLEEQARVRDLGPERIRFTGRVAAAEVPDWLRAADAFALVSPNEGFSCALAEAMSVGLPAVVSAIPANVQLIDDGVHGYTAPAGDVSATASAIQRLLSDAEGQRRMGKAARQRVVENYSLGQIVDRYESLFTEILPPSR